MEFHVNITISLKGGMLDPEARAIQHALSNLGFETGDLNTARIYRISLNAADAGEARRTAEEMCQRLLANPVIHSYEIEVGQ